MTGYPIIVRHHFVWYDPASWISWLIRVCTSSEWNHCGLMLEIDGVKCVVEARGAGIVCATLEQWIRHRKRKTWKVGTPLIPVPQETRRRIIDLLGVGYDKESLFIWQPYRLIFGRWIGGKSPYGKLTCSEFVGLVWKEEFPNNWTYLVTEDIVRSNKFKFY